MKYVSTFFLVSMAACGGPEGASFDEEPAPDAPKHDPTAPGPACSVGKSYAGFGGETLGGDRVQAESGTDRRRVKSYAALTTEYRRILGAVPSRFATAETTYGTYGSTWFAEPTPSAVMVHVSYLVAFEGCLGVLQGAKYDATPSDDAARNECSDMGRKFWSRDLSPGEVDECAALATKGTGGEPDATRRWAHVCAALASASPFLTY